MASRTVGFPVLAAGTHPYIDVMYGLHDRRRLVINSTPTSGEAERVGIGDASNYVNIMTTGETLPDTAALRIAPPTALGINGQPTRNPSGQLPPGFSLVWTNHDAPLQIGTDGPEGAVVQAPRNAINSRTIVYLCWSKTVPARSFLVRGL